MRKKSKRLPVKVGVVDLGTNSVRFAIYELADGKSANCLYKKKLMLRPGQGVYRTGRLKTGTIRKLSQAFNNFHKRTQREKVMLVKAVATSALREAKNSGQLIRRVKKNTGIEIRVISGTQEAHLIAKGILQFDPPRAAKAVLIDIGGGSTELSLCQNGKRQTSLSLPLGALRLQQLFLHQDTAQHVENRLAGVAQLRRAVQAVFRQKLRTWPARSGQLALGSSGTIRAVARLLDRQRQQHRFSRLWQTQSRAKPRLKFTRRELRLLVERMLPMSRAELLRLPGMERRRLDIILTGAILLLEILDFLEVDQVRTTNHALRDGILLEFKPRRKMT
ncbi:MAG: hypothetical protein AB7N80_02840 [Bdellovibrionales bacterium]